MKQTLATAGHQAIAAASRPHALVVGQVSYPWSTTDARCTAIAMNGFVDTSKATRRRSESSP
jgi:hypothetical protein